MKPLRALPLLIIGLVLGACLPATPPPADPWQALRQPDGSVLWLDEYRFVPPPAPWQIIDLNESDYSLALYKSCAGRDPGESPCESTMAYAEEPFGYSRDLAERAREFLKRYLWASRVVFTEPTMTPSTIGDRDVLVVTVGGEEPVRRYRLQAKIVFMHRGERVVAFFTNQWRANSASFSADEFADFDRFVASFRFVKPSFYETL